MALFSGGWRPLVPAWEYFGLGLIFSALGRPLPALAAGAAHFAWFAGKSLVLVFVLMWIRGTLPRVRVDQLMAFSYKILIPAAFANLAFAGFWVVLR